MDKFLEKVYQIVRKIPKGKVMTYGQIAEMLGDKRKARIVGFALHANKDPKNIPCHRVVNRFGKLAKGFAFKGQKEQQRRLKKEGVTVDKNGRIDLKKYSYFPSPPPLLHDAYAGTYQLVEHFSQNNHFPSKISDPLLKLLDYKKHKQSFWP